jgi:chromate transport protein ChrA
VNRAAVTLAAFAALAVLLWYARVTALLLFAAVLLALVLDAGIGVIRRVTRLARYAPAL